MNNMGLSTFDLSDNDREYSLILLRILKNIIMSEKIQFVLGDTNCLIKLYQRFKVNPFTLKFDKCASASSNKFTVEFSNIAKRVLVINKYRCPGPMVEILSALQGLSVSENLDIVIFDNKIDINSMSKSIQQRGYLLTEIIHIGSNFSKITIAANLKV